MMKKVRIYLIFLALTLFLIPIINSTCTVIFDRSGNYSQGETISAKMSCSDVNEKNNAYTLNWTNESGYQINIDIGTTPNNVNENFFNTFFIPLDYVSVNGTNITATLQGTNLEGSDIAEISTANTNDLIIQDISLTDTILIHKVFSIEAEVYDENNKRIDNSICRLEILDTNNNPVDVLLTSTSIDGEIAFSTLISPNTLSEGKQYELEIHCSCGIINTTNSCFDEDGVAIDASTGVIDFPFTINTWLTINTVTDKSSYNLKNELTICANVTNNINNTLLYWCVKGC